MGRLIRIGDRANVVATRRSSVRTIVLVFVSCLTFVGSGIAEAAGACFGSTPTIVGTSGIDRIVGTDGPDVISAGGGDDVIEGLGGRDLICSGEGDDVVNTGDGDDRAGGGKGC